MDPAAVESGHADAAVEILAKMPAFHVLSGNRENLVQVCNAGQRVDFEPGQALVTQGSASETFYVPLSGVVSIYAERGEGQRVHLGDLAAPTTLGEIGVLLGQPRSATVEARTSVEALEFPGPVFRQMLERVPGFGLSLLRHMAQRVQAVSRQIPLPELELDESPDPATLELLPSSLMERHRLLPLRTEGSVLTVGFVDDPHPAALEAVRNLLPSLELRIVRISAAAFDRVMGSRAGVQGLADKEAPAAVEVEAPPKSPVLDALLQRMVAEGASDLHLAAGHRPRWRIDGELREIRDARVLAASTVTELLGPVLAERHRAEFERELDVDFTYTVPGVGRFRINLFRDHRGANAAMRLIPSKILSLEQLGMPKILERFCDAPRGLVLVTGPTGSGKSTTLAAMIQHINRSRPAHIITLEDPVEFVHTSDQALIHQREIGGDARSYARALRAALREDPEVVLVGELRDVETMALAIETANTGHLVFATMHTRSAHTAVERLIDAFPPEQHPQVRSTVADVLRGVVCQTLVKQRGGGRVAAVEVLVVTRAISNLLREAKTFQIQSLMQTGRADGHIQLNDALAELYRKDKVTLDEALAKATERDDLLKRLERTRDPAAPRNPDRSTRLAPEA